MNVGMGRPLLADELEHKGPVVYGLQRSLDMGLGSHRAGHAQGLSSKDQGAHPCPQAGPLHTHTHRVFSQAPHLVIRRAPQPTPSPRPWSRLDFQRAVQS